MATVRSCRGAPTMSAIGTVRPRASAATQVSLKVSHAAWEWLTNADKKNNGTRRLMSVNGSRFDRRRQDSH